jgi:hypothetical protein
MQQQLHQHKVDNMYMQQQLHQHEVDNMMKQRQQHDQNETIRSLISEIERLKTNIQNDNTK